MTSKPQNSTGSPIHIFFSPTSSGRPILEKEMAPHVPSIHHVTAACFEHEAFIGHSAERMDGFARDLLGVLAEHARQTFAWCVLVNHYHALVEAPDILGLIRQLGLLHGRKAHAWNGEEETRGRKVFFRCAERAMRTDRHFWATLNYVHHNPVHHGYVARWTDWPWSSAKEYLAQTGTDEAERIWREYPLGDYGKGWDEEGM